MPSRRSATFGDGLTVVTAATELLLNWISCVEVLALAKLVIVPSLVACKISASVAEPPEGIVPKFATTAAPRLVVVPCDGVAVTKFAVAGSGLGSTPFAA